MLLIIFPPNPTDNISIKFRNYFTFFKIKTTAAFLNVANKMCFNISIHQKWLINLIHYVTLDQHRYRIQQHISKVTIDIEKNSTITTGCCLS